MLDAVTVGDQMRQRSSVGEQLRRVLVLESKLVASACARKQLKQVLVLESN